MTNKTIDFDQPLDEIWDKLDFEMKTKTIDEIGFDTAVIAPYSMFWERDDLSSPFISFCFQKSPFFK